MFEPRPQLALPFQDDRLLEVRVSRMKKLRGVNVMSGIDKTLCDSSVHLTKLGLVGDEHDLTFHGGPDKAVLGYCSSHYADWQSTYPDRTERFVPGGFGENFVTAHMNERNVCIGDIVSVGSEVLLQVSLPRQPCFKLNHRFEIKKFAPVTYETSRTGWYYRVLKEGDVTAGDEIRLVERQWPEWTVERIQEYLHRNTEDDDMNEKIAQIEPLGKEARGQFQKRVAKAKARADTKGEFWKDYRVISRTKETSRVVTIVLEPNVLDESAKEKVAGLHARLKLPNGLIRNYSVVSGEGVRLGKRLELGVSLDKDSRGGSRYIHEQVNVGDILQVGRITSSIDPAASASKHIFVVGGIGITAYLAMMVAFHRINWDFELHYAVASSEDVPFKDRLAPFGEKVNVYDKTKGQRMDIETIVDQLPWNSHLYVCGPDRMTQAVQSACAKFGVSSNEVHYEAFGADVSGDPFEVEVANRGGKSLKVGANESLLEVLRREFDQVPSSCEVGNCGTCKVALTNGKVQHRGTALLDEEKDQAMLSCVSRGVGKIIIEI